MWTACSRTAATTRPSARGAGPRHQLVLGKHSGAHGVRHACARLGVALSAGRRRALLERVRAHVGATKRAPSDADLMRMVLQVKPRRRVLGTEA
jgi:homocitrate synthase NifV